MGVHMAAIRAVVQGQAKLVVWEVEVEPVLEQAGMVTQVVL